MMHSDKEVPVAEPIHVDFDNKTCNIKEALEEKLKDKSGYPVLVVLQNRHRNHGIPIDDNIREKYMVGIYTGEIESKDSLSNGAVIRTVQHACKDYGFYPDNKKWTIKEGPITIPDMNLIYLDCVVYRMALYRTYLYPRHDHGCQIIVGDDIQKFFEQGHTMDEELSKSRFQEPDHTYSQAFRLLRLDASEESLKVYEEQVLKEKINLLKSINGEYEFITGKTMNFRGSISSIKKSLEKKLKTAEELGMFEEQEEIEWGTPGIKMNISEYLSAVKKVL